MSPGVERCACGWDVTHGPGFLAAVEGMVRVLGIEGLEVESVEVYEGRCHSVEDEGRILGLGEGEGGCVLSEEVREAVLGWWEGV